MHIDEVITRNPQSGRFQGQVSLDENDETQCGANVAREGLF